MGNYFSSDTTTIRKYGCKKDKEDKRDFYHNFSISDNHESIRRIDLSSKCPPVFDQGDLGSCTANAISAVYKFDEIKEGEGEQDKITPSRLFIYYNERSIEGNVNEDTGASVRDGIKSINRIGVCSESMWPYDISKFAEKPPEECFKNATCHKAVEYKRVQQILNQLKQCLIEGFPMVFGFTVYQSFEGPEIQQTGVMPMPQTGEKILGLHCCYIIGFDDDKKAFLVRNSWGESWGPLKGNFWMPYDFAVNSDYCSDFWTIKRVVDSHENNQKFVYPKKTLKNRNNKKNRKNKKNNRRNAYSDEYEQKGNRFDLLNTMESE